MFDNHNHLYAIATALGSLGGFQESPEWFKDFAKTSVWQIFLLATLIWQGGGNLDMTYSVVVAIIFYFTIKLSSYVKFNISDVEYDQLKAPPAEATAEEAEEFLGYY